MGQHLNWGAFDHVSLATIPYSPSRGGLTGLYTGTLCNSTTKKSDDIHDIPL